MDTGGNRRGRRTRDDGARSSAKNDADDAARKQVKPGNIMPQAVCVQPHWLQKMDSNLHTSTRLRCTPCTEMQHSPEAAPQFDTLRLLRQCKNRPEKPWAGDPGGKGALRPTALPRARTAQPFVNASTSC